MLGPDAAAFPLPESPVFAAAQTVSFDELLGDLNRIDKAVLACSRKVDKVLGSTTDEALAQPFKDVMEAFLTDSSSDVTELKQAASKAQEAYTALVEWFRFKPKGAAASSVLPADFFGVWTTFAAQGLEAWTALQQQLARKQFEAARLAKQQQQDAVTTKKSTGAGLKSKLKKRFGRQASIDAGLTQSLPADTDAGGASEAGVPSANESGAIENRRDESTRF